MTVVQPGTGTRRASLALRTSSFVWPGLFLTNTRGERAYTKMIKDLQCDSLKSWRQAVSLLMMYRIHTQQVAINCSDVYMYVWMIHPKVLNRDWSAWIGHSTFFGGCVPQGFQNVGPREWIFLKNVGLGNKKLEKFGSSELEFGPKHGWKCKNFLKIENRGHKSGALKW